MSSAFIPLFNKLPNQLNHLEETGTISKKEFYSLISIFLSLVLIVIVIIGISLSTPLSQFLFSLQSQPELKHINATSLLLKILFPYIGLISLCSLQQSVLESHDKFMVSASAPIVFNLITISATILVLVFFKNEYLTANHELTQTIWISIGVVIGGVGQFIYPFLVVRKIGYRFFYLVMKKKLKAKFQNPFFKKFIKLLIPVFFSSGFYQLQVFLIDPIALYLGEGSISTLYYSNRLMEFPLGIISVAITTASLPLLSKKSQWENSHENRTDFINLIKRSLNLVYLLFIPIMIVSIVHRETLISLVFKFYNFKQQDVIITAQSFLFHILSIPALASYRIFFNVFYAKGNTKVPLLISIINLVFGISLTLFLVKIRPQTSSIAMASMITAYLLFISSIVMAKIKLNLSLYKFFLKRIIHFVIVLVLSMPLIFLIYRLLDPFFSTLYYHFSQFENEILPTKIVQLLELGLFSTFVFGFYLIALGFTKEKEVIFLLNKILVKKIKP